MGWRVEKGDVLGCTMSLGNLLKRVLEVYWVHYFGGYLFEERIQDLGNKPQN